MLNVRGALLLSLCLLFACNRSHHNVTKGFYYWKTIYKTSQYERSTLQQLGVHKMYVRFFDVDEDAATGHTLPIAPVRIEAKDSGFAYIPVIFITQRALITLNDSAVPQLANSICGLTQSLCGQAGLTPQEVQIDCDWTKSTKEKYFHLLRLIKQDAFINGKTLSCTIRLNQVKYKLNTGIPPVDKGLLMCYGMGTLKKFGPYNSILDADAAKDYLKHIDDYPLPMDMALPIFEWCVLFREQQFRGILHEVTTADLSSCELFKQNDRNLYICLHDSVWHSYRLQRGDIIRAEAPVYEDLLTMAGYSAARIKNTDLNVILFACDSITLSKYSPNDLQAVYNCYR